MNNSNLKSNLKAYEVFVLISFPDVARKFVKKYIVVSTSIPKNNADLKLPENEDFIEAKEMPHEVIVK